MSVASAVYERTCHVCDVVRFYVLKTIYQIQRGRQLSTNERIFTEMSKLDRDAPYHLIRIQEATNAEYDEKIRNLK
tara:strand:+ start:428 stop:655 length:228 start_codon:yes stop_codon:yes gene_type:complete